MLKKIIFIFILVILLLKFGYFTDVRYNSPIWSKDGDRIYYIKIAQRWRPVGLTKISLGDEIISIMSMRADGSNKKVVIKSIVNPNTVKKALFTHVRRLKILPNNKELIFHLVSPQSNETGIYKINTSGTNLTKLVSQEPGRLFLLSPDGKKIAYTKDGTCWLMDSDGQNNHMIYKPLSQVLGWTFDEKLIIQFSADVSHSIHLNYEILIYDVSTDEVIKRIPMPENGDLKALLRTLGPITEYSGILSEYSEISPDGKRKIFYYVYDVAVMDIDGKNKKILLKSKGDVVF